MTITKPRIEKAFEQYKLNSDYRCYYNEFEKAIEDNLPPQIPVEVIKQLIIKNEKELEKYRGHEILENVYKIVVDDLCHLYALLPKQTDGN